MTVSSQKARTRYRAAFNIFELLLVVLLLAGGIAGGVYFAHRYDVVGAVAGSCGGAGAVLGVLYLPMFLCDWWVPPYPACKCGNAGTKAYRFEGWLAEHDGSIYSCRTCGCRFVKTQRRFREMLEDGTLVPHFFHRFGGRWRKETPPAMPGTRKER